jgi:hypothetical protein
MTNKELLYSLIMEEMIELRTPNPSQCICVLCQKEKSDFAERLIPKITKHFQRKKYEKRKI